ncbi:hypothetical protein L8O18_06110 [Enterobacter asburiae]|nr:hypothetical protein [Escherichia coli]MCK7258039.1 hypothetical protein [Enterobacter asburiae]
MTREEAIAVLKELQGKGGDVEMDHIRADDVLCEMLKTLGFEDVVIEYDAINKWYA